MKEMGYSQIPVLAGTSVLGVFSYRSFAESASKLGRIKAQLHELTVEDFLEKVYSPGSLTILGPFWTILDSGNPVLVGEQERLRGIITGVDVVQYLYEVTSPFLLISDIERALRALIKWAIDEGRFVECANARLRANMRRLAIPITVLEMEFGDYVDLIGNGENWKYFVPVFGGMREIVRAKLEDIRDLRNDVFHFRRDLSSDERGKLLEYREWVLVKARKVDAQSKEAGSERRSEPAANPRYQVDARKTSWSGMSSIRPSRPGTS